MKDAAFEQIGDGRQPDVGMRSHLHPAARRYIHWTEMVEKDERADHPALDARKDPANGEAAAQVVRPSLDQKLDRITHLVLPACVCCNA